MFKRFIIKTHKLVASSKLHFNHQRNPRRATGVSPFFRYNIVRVKRYFHPMAVPHLDNKSWYAFISSGQSEIERGVTSTRSITYILIISKEFFNFIQNQ